MRIHGDTSSGFIHVCPCSASHPCNKTDLSTGAFRLLVQGAHPAPEVGKAVVFVRAVGSANELFSGTIKAVEGSTFTIHNITHLKGNKGSKEDLEIYKGLQVKMETSKYCSDLQEVKSVRRKCWKYQE